jgi:hypothetical protein
MEFFECNRSKLKVGPKYTDFPHSVIKQAFCTNCFNNKRNETLIASDGICHSTECALPLLNMTKK